MSCSFLNLSIGGFSDGSLPGKPSECLIVALNDGGISTCRYISGQSGTSPVSLLLYSCRDPNIGFPSYLATNYYLAASEVGKHYCYHLQLDQCFYDQGSLIPRPLQQLFGAYPVVMVNSMPPSSTAPAAAPPPPTSLIAPTSNAANLMPSIDSLMAVSNANQLTTATSSNVNVNAPAAAVVPNQSTLTSTAGPETGASSTASSSSNGVVVGISVALVLIVVGTIGVFCFFYMKKRKGRFMTKDEHIQLEEDVSNVAPTSKLTFSNFLFLIVSHQKAPIQLI